MKSISLDAKYSKTIIDIILKYLDKDNLKIYVFGSRAKGTYRPKSDIDIAIDYKKLKLDNSIKAKIKADFENSSIPFFIDLLDLNNMNPEFKNLINESLIEINLNNKNCTVSGGNLG
jgi:predicted nucleotidyltransferase